MAFLALNIMSRGESKAAVDNASSEELVHLLEVFSAFISTCPCFDQVGVDGFLGYSVQDVAQELGGIMRPETAEFVCELVRKHGDAIHFSIVHKFGS